MKDLLSNRVKNLKPSLLSTFFSKVVANPQAISLSVGEPDFDTPWHISNAGIDAIQDGKTFYSEDAGQLGLRKEICSYLKRRFSSEYTPEEILVTVGASEAIDALMRAILNDGDEVLVLAPVYVSYIPCIELSGGKAVAIELDQEDGFKLTPEKLEGMIGPKTKAILLNYPNNPTGAIMTHEDYERIVPILAKHDIVVISDEIYVELTYGKESASLSSFPTLKDRLVVLNGFSKAYSMTGWRLGYAAGPIDLIKAMTKIHQYSILSSPTISQFAAIEALRNGDEDIREMRDEYASRRDFVVSRIKQIGLDCYEPEGAFYVFPNIEEFGIDSVSFATRLLEEEELAVIPGLAFGEKGDSFIRISYAYSLEELKDGLERLDRFVRKLRKEGKR